MLCQMCGNEIPAFSPSCPFCGHQQGGTSNARPKFPLKSVNIKHDLPTVEAALNRMTLEIDIARSRNYRALKIIHGYGSTGIGGQIRPAVRQMAAQMTANGRIAGFVEGEEFRDKTAAARKWISMYPWLKNDKDYNGKNPGIILLFLN